MNKALVNIARSVEGSDGTVTLSRNLANEAKLEGVETPTGGLVVSARDLCRVCGVGADAPPAEPDSEHVRETSVSDDPSETETSAGEPESDLTETETLAKSSEETQAEEKSAYDSETKQDDPPETETDKPKIDEKSETKPKRSYRRKSKVKEPTDGQTNT